MPEPFIYCSCGNNKKYNGNWEIESLPVKIAIKKLIDTGSLTSKEKCPICLCLESMDRAKLALKSF
jgi:hypothetical protein